MNGLSQKDVLSCGLWIIQAPLPNHAAAYVHGDTPISIYADVYETYEGDFKGVVDGKFQILKNREMLYKAIYQNNY